MRVFVADRFPERHIERLRAHGHEVAYAPDTSVEGLQAATGHDVLVVRSTPVRREAIESLDGLRIVIRAGSGTDTIDTGAAERQGIAVCNVPGKNAVAVAELAFGLLLAIDRRIPEQVADARAGTWRKQHYQQATGIAGRRVGVVGLGEIGLAFAERATAFGCRVHGLDRPDRAPSVIDRLERIGLRSVPDLATLAATCDVLSFHVPARPETRGLIGRPLLDHVRPGAILINTARGELVDEGALLAAIDEKGLRVGLDVFPGEPAAEGRHGSRLAAHPSVYVTHHVGASTRQAQDAVADEVVEMVEAFAGGEVRNCVNDVVFVGATRRP